MHILWPNVQIYTAIVFEPIFFFTFFQVKISFFFSKQDLNTDKKTCFAVKLDLTLRQGTWVFVYLDGACDGISMRTQELDESQVLLPGCSVLGGSTVSIALQQDPIPLCLSLPPLPLLSFPPSPSSFPTAALGISLLMQKWKSDAFQQHSTNKINLCTTCRIF